MLFAKKSKGFCVELGEQSTLIARLSQSEAPLVVEELKEFAANDSEGLVAWTKGSEGKGATGYAHATCGIYPAKRIVRRHTLDLKRAKDPAYFSEIYSQQFRVESDKYVFKALNPDDGSEYDQAKGTQKEALFCGLPQDDINAIQDKLLEEGIYPERLELGTVATLGGMISYLKFKQSKTPVLLLEIGQETTQSFILSAEGVDISRPIQSGIAAMIPVVQKELGLKDEESAKKLFYSNTFDFTSMGGVLVKKLLKELQSSIGFYEVQTGQSIGNVFCTQLPASLAWIGQTMATSLGVPPLKVEITPWLDSQGIKFSEGVALTQPEERWFGLFSLLASYQNAVPDEKSDAQPVAAPLWHANFRNFERLPDTKVVRTTFFINAAAVAVALGMLIWVGSREITNRSIRDQIAEAQRQIDGNTKQNAEAIRLSKTFADEQKKLDEAVAFVKGPITVTEFVGALGQTLPKEILIDSVDARLGDPKNASFFVKGRVAGSPDQASGLASNYVDMLRADAKLSAVFDPITLDRIDRDPSGTFLTFDISLTVKGGKK